jgi:phosphinothricin acetyltransferase
MTSFRLRPMREDDLGTVNAIYNHYVVNSTCTYQLEPETDAARAAWFAAGAPGYPRLVVEDAGRVVGWAALTPYHHRGGYARTVENAIYVDVAHHRRGIGAMLLDALVTGARADGHHVIVARIDGDQAASIALHGRFGFVHAGRLHEIGYKFGRWLDVVDMQLTL